ncbi:hypothetical protein CDD80_3983 [Ophiocordyceps camponoti-rufipedis]|uniref:Beta-lactamase-related domain-containing protein n=1 Tax=Ophiocordyceps camponoti-rufipedis TaxID=2004952 RepID=A0A2C5Z0B5_9HYPO|nr:hypothetical protein CDD80_3983 [Ophiocordyceps camponoti-rufipedis]
MKMDRLDDILRAYVAEGEDTADKVLGAAFVVVNKDGIVYQGAAGRIGFDTASRPFAVDSFTWVASLTKLVTATCVMQLVEAGTIGLDDDVRPLVPELGRLQILRGFGGDDEPVLEDNVLPITLRHWCEKVGHPVRYTDWSIGDISMPLLVEPGQGWIYGTGLDWAGLVLERVTGQGLGEYMQAHIFDPLAMSDTGFWPDKLPQTASRSVDWSRRRAGSTTLEPMEQLTPVTHEMESGGGGLYSTARDYARFLGAFLSGRLVSEATMQLMFSPQLDAVQKEALNEMIYRPGLHNAAAPEFPTGLELDHGISGAINMQDVPGKRLKGSLMWSGMSNSHWWIDRQTGIATVLVLNVYPMGDAVVARLYDALERAVYADA